jgi:hypothetical protein
VEAGTGCQAEVKSMANPLINPFPGILAAPKPEASMAWNTPVPPSQAKQRVPTVDLASEIELTQEHADVFSGQSPAILSCGDHHRNHSFRDSTGYLQSVLGAYPIRARTLALVDASQL